MKLKFIVTGHIHNSLQQQLEPFLDIQQHCAYSYISRTLSCWTRQYIDTSAHCIVATLNLYILNDFWLQDQTAQIQASSINVYIFGLTDIMFLVKSIKFPLNNYIVSTSSFFTSANLPHQAASNYTTNTTYEAIKKYAQQFIYYYSFHSLFP